MIYIPYESYHDSVKVLDDERLQTQATAILPCLNGLTQGWRMPGWDKSTRCDLATLGLYTCSELRWRGYFVIYEKRIKAAWFRLHRPGKLRQRVQRPEQFYASMRELLVWEDPDLYEEKFGLTYSPFKPKIYWNQ